MNQPILCTFKETIRWWEWIVLYIWIINKACCLKSHNLGWKFRLKWCLQMTTPWRRSTLVHPGRNIFFTPFPLCPKLRFWVLCKLKMPERRSSSTESANVPNDGFSAHSHLPMFQMTSYAPKDWVMLLWRRKRSISHVART